MSREGKLAKNTAILAIGTFFPKIAIFITLPILTAFMPQSDYGNYDLIVSMQSLVLPIATLMIQSAAFRFLIDVKDDDKNNKSVIITNIYSFVLRTSIAFLVIAFICILKLPLTLRGAICMYYFVSIFNDTNKQICRGIGNNTIYSLGSFVSSIGCIVFAVLLVRFMGHGLIGGLISLIVSEMISAVILFWGGKIYSYINWHLINKTQIRSMISYSWPMIPNSLSQWVMHVSDRIVITLFMGSEANAIYAVAYKLPSILAFAQTTFNMAWQENASVVSKDDDAASYYSNMFDSLFRLVAGCMGFLIGITPILFRMLIKGDYESSYKQIPILYMGIFFYCLSSFWGGIFVAFKKTKVIAATTFLAAIINILIDLVSIQWIGLYAASVSTLISYVCLCLFRLIATDKIIKIQYNRAQTVIVLIILIGQCLLSIMRVSYLDVANFIIGIIMLIGFNHRLIRKIINKFGGIDK